MQWRLVPIRVPADLGVEPDVTIQHVAGDQREARLVRCRNLTLADGRHHEDRGQGDDQDGVPQDDGGVRGRFGCHGAGAS